MRVLIVANPRSGRNQGLFVARQAVAVLEQGGWSVTVLPTTAPGQAATLARQGARDGYEIVFACGGDGTLSQVINGLLDTGVPTGLLPAGTGNDFARMVGVSRDPVLAARQALQGAPGRVDLFSVNDGAAWAVNIMGIGFDAAVAARMNRRVRLTGGAFAYVTAVLQELATHRAGEIELEIDGATWHGRALLVALANAVSYGGGMKIAPQASVTDGLMDVILVGEISKPAFLRAFPRVFRGTHLTHPAITAWQAKRVTVRSAAPQPVLLDGDLYGMTPVTAEVEAGRGLLWLPGE